MRGTSQKQFPIPGSLPEAHSPLAVFSPIVGRWGQPWLKAHIDGILPGRTVVVAICAFEPSGPCWGVDAPLLYVPPRLPSNFKNQPANQTIIERISTEHNKHFWSTEHLQRIQRFLIEHGVEV